MLYRDMELFNVASLRTDERGTRINRLPELPETDGNPELAKNTSFHAAGCELRFNIEGDAAEITLYSPEEPYYSTYGIIEIFYGEYAAYSTLTPYILPKDGSITLSIPRPAMGPEFSDFAKREGHRYDPFLVRVVLPYNRKITVTDVKGRLSPPRDDQVTRRSMLCYGSSITHGFFAVRTGDNYPSRLGRAFCSDVYNLGFGGCAHMDEAVARHIVTLSFEIATLEMGINVYGGWEQDFFRERVRTFLGIITGARPDAKIFALDMFSHLGEYAQGENERAAAYRQIVRDCVRENGSPNLISVEAQPVASESTDMSVDLLHPSSDGFEAMAAKLAGEIRKHL